MKNTPKKANEDKMLILAYVQGRHNTLRWRRNDGMAAQNMHEAGSSPFCFGPEAERRGEPDYTNSKPTPSVIFPSVMVYFLNFPESSLIAPPSGN